MLHSHLHHDCFAVKIKINTCYLEGIYITTELETYSRAVITVVWTAIVFRIIFGTPRASICEPRKHELKKGIS